MTEKAFQAAVVQAATFAGWKVYHTFDSRRSPAGFPDLVLVRPPDVLFVELKTDTGRVRLDQEQWLAALKACTAVEAHVWRPRQMDEVLARLGLKV